jgi:hypothetical protein
MKVFQDLSIGPLTAGQERRLVERLESRLDEGWHRDKQREEELGRSSPSGTYWYCFVCSKNQDRQHAGLFLAPKEKTDPHLLYVANIVPADISELDYDQYNQILCEFHTRFLAPAAGDLGVTVKLSAPNVAIDQALSPEAFRLLKSFSHLANKSTGSSHPLDRKRWFDFLIFLHRAGESPDESLIERWLVEEEHWSEDKATQLIIEYEFARGLLDQYGR